MNIFYNLQKKLFDGDLRQPLIWFACFPPEPKIASTSKAIPYLLFFSSIFLIATLVVYSLLPELRNVHGVSIMCQVASMAVMYIGLGIIQLTANMSTGACIFLGITNNWVVFKYSY